MQTTLRKNTKTLGIISMSNEDRLKIWRALSDLFLDTEIEDYVFKNIARTVSECGLSLSEAEEILWYEVYPVLEGNLRSVAGVWEGWSDSWLVQNLPAPVRLIAIDGDTSIIKEIKRCWRQVTKVY
ncbi:MAG: hypothetical protein ACJAT8_001786 [Cellvibrionaceae bacterium]